MLAGIVPQFDEMIREFSEEARPSNDCGVHCPHHPRRFEHGLSDSQVLEKYVALLVAHHSQTLAPAVIDSLIREISPAKEWLTSVDSRRPIFAEVTRRVDAALGVETSNKVTYELRVAAVGKVEPEGRLAPQTPGGSRQDQSPSLGPERFLDTEIVAIYW